MIATRFLAKGCLAHRQTPQALSWRDVEDSMRHRIATDEDLAASTINRHRRRRQAMESSYRKQVAMLSASD